MQFPGKTNRSKIAAPERTCAFLCPSALAFTEKPHLNVWVRIFKDIQNDP